MTISSHLTDVIASYISTRTQRLALDKEAAALKEQEDLLKDLIVSKYRDQNLTALGCDTGIVKMTTLKEPVATDWAKVYEFVKANDAFELLHRRLANLAVKERWEAGEEIPGVGVHEVYKLSVSAPPKKA
jgi:hypothetical protein